MNQGQGQGVNSLLCYRKLRQQEFQEKRELLEFTESQLNQLTYEIKEEIKQHTEEVERKVCQHCTIRLKFIKYDPKCYIF